jgi:ribonuclease HII
MADLEHELKLKAKGYQTVAGADEVGKGAWAGPVVAAAVVLPDDLEAFVWEMERDKLKIDDSKVLTALQRHYSASWLRQRVTYGIGQVSVNEINNKGIVKATQKAFRMAISQTNDALVDRKIEFLMADGYKIPRIKGVSRSLQIDIVKGDGKSITIAAASIIAKVYRDEVMESLSQEFLGYEWGSNKGYGTLAHRMEILKRGMCCHHRTQFVNTWLYKKR